METEGQNKYQVSTSTTRVCSECQCQMFSSWENTKCFSILTCTVYCIQNSWNSSSNKSKINNNLCINNNTGPFVGNQTQSIWFIHTRKFTRIIQKLFGCDRDREDVCSREFQLFPLRLICLDLSSQWDSLRWQC